jgi:hypothetical protein
MFLLAFLGAVRCSWIILFSSEKLFHFSAFIMYNFLIVKLGKFACLYVIRMPTFFIRGLLKYYSGNHNVNRVQSFFSSRWNWDSRTPSPTGECAAPPLFQGGNTCMRKRGGVGPSSNEGTYTVVL